MLNERVGEVQWTRLCELLAESLGLHFPRERWADLQRALVGAARELGFNNVAQCIDWIVSTNLEEAQQQVLVRHLTIGETYFFRDRATMSILAEEILPELILKRRGCKQSIRIWSAACCTGEEPYSLAILLHRLVPDLPSWQITIMATDINRRFLEKAEAGIYGEWSFRDTPPHIRQRYFERTASGDYAIVPEIRKLVKFERLNLVDGSYRLLGNEVSTMDLIFCRNVLMYFASHQVRKVVRRLHSALAEEGWLVVSPSEASQSAFAQFTTVNRPGVILYRKIDPSLDSPPVFIRSMPEANSADVGEQSDAPFTRDEREAAAVLPAPPKASKKPSPAAEAAQALYAEGRYAELAGMLLKAASEGVLESQAYALLTRALANQGRLADALTWCDRWIAADKLNAAAHYFRAVVLLEQGDPAKARLCLQRAIYLEADFVLAHFSLGSIARAEGRPGEAQRHFSNALHLLSRYEVSDVLPESEGLTAGRLGEILSSIPLTRMTT